jgi:hypothetical protein
MSLYREPGRRRWTWLVAGAIAAAVLLAIGFGIGRATAPEPSLSSQLSDLASEVAPAADALELVAIHYDSTNETTREAARTQLDRAEELYAGVEDDLTLVNRAGAAAARESIDDLAALVAAGAPATEVEEAATAAEDAVRAAAPST